MMLSRLVLDRNTGVPLFRQLRAAIEMAIIEGELADGIALPSVRALANTIDVAPITVLQAYKALQSEGLVQSVPKRGFFVTVNPSSSQPSASLQRVRELIDHALRAALESGIDEVEFARIAVERARNRRNGNRTVAIFGYRDASLQERVHLTAEAISDLNVDVIGIPFEEIESLAESDRGLRLDHADLYLVSVGEIETATGLLRSRSSRILPMTRVPRNDVVAFVERQPETALFGIIGDSPEYADRIVAVLRRMKSLVHSPLTATVTDTPAVEHLLAETDVVLIGSLAASKLDRSLLEGKQAIEFVSVPDTATLTKLRRMLTEFA